MYWQTLQFPSSLSSLLSSVSESFRFYSRRRSVFDPSHSSLVICQCCVLHSPVGQTHKFQIKAIVAPCLMDASLLMLIHPHYIHYKVIISICCIFVTLTWKVISLGKLIWFEATIKLLFPLFPSFQLRLSQYHIAKKKNIFINCQICLIFPSWILKHLPSWTRWHLLSNKLSQN